MTIYQAMRGQPVDLGRQGEHRARRVVFDISDWVRDFGAGTVRLLHQRQDDAAPYPVSVTRTDNDGVTVNDQTGTLVLWDVTDADTATRQRYGRAELRYYSTDGGETFLAKSETYQTFVADALGAAVEDVPEPLQDWIQKLLSDTDDFENVERRFLQIDAKIDENSQRIDANSQSVGEFGRRFGELDGALAEVNDALTAANNAVESVGEQVDRAVATGNLIYNTFCRTVSGDPCFFTAESAAGLSSLTVHIVPTQSGTPSVESPAPIAGYDSVRLFLTANQATELYGYTLLDDGIRIESEDSNDITTGFIPYLPSKTYKATYFSTYPVGWNSTGAFSVFFYDENRNLLSKANVTARAKRVYDVLGNYTQRLLGAIENGPSAAREMRLCFYSAYSGTTDGERDMVFVGGPQINTASDRLTESFFKSARRADNYDISLSSAGTVYGGNLDVISGVLTVTHDYIESYNGETVPDGWISSTGQLSTGAQVVYPLDTPVTYQLAPMELAVVSGFNSIYSDAGSVTAVYWSDYASREELNNGLAEKVNVVDGKVLSSNDFTDADKSKLDGIESGAQENVIESISVNGNVVPIANKSAAISALTQADAQSLINDALADIPTKTSDLTNDSGFLTQHQSLADYVTKAAQTETDAAQNQEIADLKSEIALLRELISGVDAPVYRTASGNPATFSDGYDNAALKSCVVTIPPTQSGSGDPSPTNVRTIIGYNTITITRTDADGAESANAQTVAVALTDGTDPLTLYGGTLDLISGTLTVTKAVATLTGSEGFALASAYSNEQRSVFSIGYAATSALLPGMLRVDENPANYYNLNHLSVCSHLTIERGSAAVYDPGEYAINAHTGGYRSVWITVAPSVAGTNEAFAAWLADQYAAGTPVQILYPLATPVTYQLTPVTLTSLRGYNSVSADAGTLSVEYRADTSITLS